MKIRNLIMGGGILALLASCAHDEAPGPVQPGETVNVTFTTQLPVNLATRSFGNGTTAKKLQYAVYDSKKTLLFSDATKEFSTPAEGQHPSVDVSIPLVTGETYNIIFYADAFGAPTEGTTTTNPYSFETATGDLKVDYTKVTTNDDQFDAFYACEPSLTVNGAASKTIELKRPFAQINIATTQTDLDAAAKLNITPTKAAVALGPVYTKLNMFSGELDETTRTDGVVTFTEKEFVAGETVTVAGTEYKNLAMVYVLAPEAGESYNTVNLQFDNDLSKAYNNIPVKRNFKTNIVGNLLTSSVDYKVVIGEEFEGTNPAVVKVNENGTITCVIPALPDGVTQEMLEEKNAAGVAIDEEGNTIYFTDNVDNLAAAFNSAKEIYFAPNQVINGYKYHKCKIPKDGIRVYGNGATIHGSEIDFSVQDIPYEEGSIVDVYIENLNNIRIWGGTSTAFTMNITMKNCSFIGKGQGGQYYGLGLVMLRGGKTDSVTKYNMLIEDCYAEGVQVAFHTTHYGTFTFKNTTFKNCGIPINYAKKLDFNTTINIENCVFDGCGLDPNGTDSARDYAAPIRVVDNYGPDYSITLNVNNCEITNRKGKYDVLLMDYRTDEPRTWKPVKYNITNSGNLVVRDSAEEPTAN